MRTMISRWFLFGLLLGWALTHATVFGQQAGKTTDTKPAAVDKIRQGLDKIITIDYSGQTLAEALNHFREKTGLPINVDPVALLQMGVNQGNPMADQVTIKGTNEKASQILRRTLSTHGLAYVILDGAILVASEESAVIQQMRQRVSVNLDEVPLKKAAKDLAKNHGLNLVIDPKVMKESETPVSLQLDDTSIETTMRLLAELASLKAVRMGNVVFICSEEKAKKIQAEEKHQFDNPDRPSVFPPPPVMRIGFGGNFGGAFAPGALGRGGAPIPIQKALPPQPPGIDLPPGVQAPPAPVPPVPVEPIAPPFKKGIGAPVNPPPPPPPSVQRPTDLPPPPPRNR